MKEICHYKDANFELIRNEFNWKKSFLNIDVNEKADILSYTNSNFFSEYIPHEFVVCEDKDSIWFNKEIRKLIQEKKCCI